MCEWVFFYIKILSMFIRNEWEEDRGKENRWSRVSHIKVHINRKQGIQIITSSQNRPEKEKYAAAARIARNHKKIIKMYKQMYWMLINSRITHFILWKTKMKWMARGGRVWDESETYKCIRCILCFIKCVSWTEHEHRESYF